MSKITQKDQHWMKVAMASAGAAKCVRKSVGCVIVNQGRLCSTGYNGHARGTRGDHFCLRNKLGAVSGSNIEQGLCIHAEMNALIFADYSAIQGGHMYVTHHPCALCVRLITQAGIARCVFSVKDLYAVEKFVIAQMAHVSDVVEWVPYRDGAVYHAIKSYIDNEGGFTP